MPSTFSRASADDHCREVPLKCARIDEAVKISDARLQISPPGTPAWDRDRTGPGNEVDPGTVLLLLRSSCCKKCHSLSLIRYVSACPRNPTLWVSQLANWAKTGEQRGIVRRQHSSDGVWLGVVGARVAGPTTNTSESLKLKGRTRFKRFAKLWASQICGPLQAKATPSLLSILGFSLHFRSLAELH